MYFVARCATRDCKLRGKDAGVYIGQGRTFDFITEQRLCTCGACNQTLTDIVDILFVGCLWSYRGLQDGSSRVEASAESRADSVSMFPYDKKFKRWKWLKISVTEDAPQIRTNATVQTDGSELIAEAACQTDETHSPEKEGRSEQTEKQTLRCLIQAYERQKAKYKKLKRKQPNS